VDVTVGQVEHFLLWQLELAPERIELYYCLGFVNMHLKGDPEQARADFENFMKRCPREKYCPDREQVEKWLQELRTTLQTDSR